MNDEELIAWLEEHAAYAVSDAKVYADLPKMAEHHLANAAMLTTIRNRLAALAALAAPAPVPTQEEK